MKWIALLCFLGALPVSAESPTERWSRDVSYREGGALDDYSLDRCKLDIYAPAEGRDLPVVVWIHGGGLRGGKKEVPEALRGQGLVVVAPNYRLHPKVKAPAYIEDVAAAVAWTFENIGRYGGSSEKIVVSGHSAGGYLASMVGLDKRWLAKHEIDADRIAGLAPYSGHTVTHFTIRDERGIPKEQVVVDEFAPIFHVRADAPPMLLLTGDRELEMLGRYEETAYFYRMMKVNGHENVRLHELQGFGHNMTEPGHALLLKFMTRVVGK